MRDAALLGHGDVACARASRSALTSLAFFGVANRVARFSASDFSRVFIGKEDCGGAATQVAGIAFRRCAGSVAALPSM